MSPKATGEGVRTQINNPKKVHPFWWPRYPLTPLRRSHPLPMGEGFSALSACLVVSIAALLLAACSTGNFQPVRPIGVDAGRTAGMISSYRAEHGLGPVSVDSALMQAAADYARAMGERDKINHRIGGTLAKRVSAAGYDWMATAENLGAGLPTLDAAMTAWEASAGHRKNLLNPLVTEIGIAAVATGGDAEHDTYWALILAAPRPERVASGPFAMEQRR